MAVLNIVLNIICHSGDRFDSSLRALDKTYIFGQVFHIIRTIVKFQVYQIL